MKARKFFVVIALVFAMILPVTAASPEREITSNFTNTAAQRINGFDVEAWTDHRGAEGIQMNVYPSGAFSGVWTQTYNTLFRVGRRFSRGTSIADVGEIVMAYDVSEFRTTRGATYLGVYGWTRNPLTEWYIIENWIDWTAMQAAGTGNTVHHGTVSANGHTYDIVTSWRINQPSIEGAGMRTFMQIFSIRQGSRRNRDSTAPARGTIDISAHFAAWEEQIPPQTITAGGTEYTAYFSAGADLHEVMFVVEGFGGEEFSSGSGRVDALCLRYGANSICTESGCANCADIPEPAEAEEQAEADCDGDGCALCEDDAADEPATCDGDCCAVEPVPLPSPSPPPIEPTPEAPVPPAQRMPLMRFVIGSYVVTSDSRPPVILDAPPFIDPEFQRTMVPLRAIAEGLGAEVDWLGEVQTAIITRGENAVSVTVGEDLLGDMGVAVIVSDRTFVPVRYVSEVLGAEIRWEPDTRAVYVYE